MQEYCELKTNKDLASKSICMVKERITPELKYYYQELGYNRIRALGYKEANLKREIHNIRLYNQVKDRVYSTIKEGSIIPLRRAKLILEEIYKDVGVYKSSKGSDLKEWYDLEEKKMRMEGINTRVLIIKNVRPEEGSNL